MRRYKGINCGYQGKELIFQFNGHEKISNKEANYG